MLARMMIDLHKTADLNLTVALSGAEQPSTVAFRTHEARPSDMMDRGVTSNVASDEVSSPSSTRGSVDGTRVSVFGVLYGV